MRSINSWRIDKIVCASAKRSFRFSLYTAILLIVAVIFPDYGWADETIVVNIRVNSVAKGDFIVLQNATGQFFVKTADFPALGIQLPADIVGVEIEKEVKLITNNTFIRSSNGQHVIAMVFKCKYKSGEAKPLVYPAISCTFTFVVLYPILDGCNKS